MGRKVICSSNPNRNRKRFPTRKGIFGLQPLIQIAAGLKEACELRIASPTCPYTCGAGGLNSPNRKAASRNNSVKATRSSQRCGEPKWLQKTPPPPPREDPKIALSLFYSVLPSSGQFYSHGEHIRGSGTLSHEGSAD